MADEVQPGPDEQPLQATDATPAEPKQLADLPKPDEPPTVEEPPPKKKKLTKAEKKKLKKQLALELKRAVAEKQRQIFRDYLTREQTYAEMNRKKLEKKWRKMLIDIKVSQFRKEFVYAINNVERIFNAKDFKISILMDEIDAAGEQSELNNRSHLETIEKLIRIFYDQLNHLKTKYDGNLMNIQIDEKITSDILAKRNETFEEHLNTMLFALEVENKHDIKNMRSEYMSKIGRETTWYDQLCKIKKIDLTYIFDNMYKQYSDVFVEYFKEATKKKQLYQELKIERVNRLPAKILANQDLIKKLGKYHEVYVQEAETIETQMVDEKNVYYKAFKILKSRLNRNDKIDGNKLIEVTQISNDVIEHLKKVKESGKKILRYMSLCSKYETQKEKVLAHPNTQPDQDNRLFKHQIKCIQLEDFKLMKNSRRFWDKFAMADSSRCLLLEEQSILREENGMLKARLRQICNRANCTCVLPMVYKVPLQAKKKSRKIRRRSSINGKKTHFD